MLYGQLHPVDGFHYVFFPSHEIGECVLSTTCFSFQRFSSLKPLRHNSLDWGKEIVELVFLYFKLLADDLPPPSLGDFPFSGRISTTPASKTLNGKGVLFDVLVTVLATWPH